MRGALVRPELAGPALALLVLATVATPTDGQRVDDARIERRTATDPATVLREAGSEPTWFLWTVPATAKGAQSCCFRRGWTTRGCTLDGRKHGWGTSSEGPHAGPSPELVVLAELERGRPRDLRAVGSTCPIEGGGRRLVVLDGVEPMRSLDLLEGWARDGRLDEDVREPALAAIGHHAEGDGPERLERLALDRGLDDELRRQSLFWAGQTLGGAVVPIVDRFLASAPAREMREHAYFVLAEAESPEALARLERAAREDPAAGGRSQALFWLAQTDTAGAANLILDAIAEERDPDAREQGVFALSQLDDGVTHLSRLLRESPHAEVRRQALFWLAQSDDPRALEEVERILDP